MVARFNLKELVSMGRRTLTAREEIIIILRKYKYRFSEIGTLLKISGKRVSEIHKKALRISEYIALRNLSTENSSRKYEIFPQE